MSVPKGKRTVSDVIYFDFAYTLIEKITKYLLTDFGITKTYRDLHVFSYKAKMDIVDQQSFNELVEKYHLGTGSIHSLWRTINTTPQAYNI